ncbi:LysE family translocator [Undibacterium sp. TJN19]|uniref:LysE family translocator n=1 Tax=Undibacterium sp. TJN19 TaxID=3413055 RepID=UPI003BF138D7
MISFSTLTAFCIAVLFLLCSPGPNMAFIMTCGMQYGMRGSVAAALGIASADIILTVLTASGVSAIITAWPPSFDLIRYAGVLYLLWLAKKALTIKPASAKNTRPGDVVIAPLRTVFMQSCLNSLLNPKALLFFMVFLPQFVDARQGTVTQQLLLLGLLLTAISTVFHATLGSFSVAIRNLLTRHQRLAQVQPYALAAVLILLALRLVMMER